MARSDPQTCPPPEVLGAFIEGKLERATQATVKRHVASCSQCIFVVGNANAFLTSDEAETEEESEGQPRRWRWTAAATAAMVIACTLAGIWLAWKRRDPLDDLRHAIAAAQQRPVEGQLAGFPYAPYRVPRSDASDFDPRIEIEAKRLMRVGGNDARAWHARGIGALVLGDAAKATAMLEKAVVLSPRDAAYWNDLAAAHLAIGANDNERQLGEAVSAATKAETLDASLAAAPFNRALALERAGNSDAALQAYDRCLSLHRDDAWASEARLLRDRLAR